MTKAQLKKTAEKIARELKLPKKKALELTQACIADIYRRRIEQEWKK